MFFLREFASTAPNPGQTGTLCCRDACPAAWQPGSGACGLTVLASETMPGRTSPATIC